MRTNNNQKEKSLLKLLNPSEWSAWLLDLCIRNIVFIIIVWGTLSTGNSEESLEDQNHNFIICNFAVPYVNLSLIMLEQCVLYFNPELR